MQWSAHFSSDADAGMHLPLRTLSLPYFGPRCCMKERNSCLRVLCLIRCDRGRPFQAKGGLGGSGWCGGEEVGVLLVVGTRGLLRVEDMIL